MIDPADKQTQALPLEQQKRGRGRPATGAAMTPAEKQKAYRERLKGNVTAKEESHEEIEKLREMARAEFKRAESLQAKVVDMSLQIAQLQHEVKKLKQDAMPSRLNQGMRKIIQDVHDVADAIEGSTWRIQRKSNSGKWKALMGEYRNEAHAIDTIMSLPPGNPNDQYRAVEVNLKIED